MIGAGTTVNVGLMATTRPADVVSTTSPVVAFAGTVTDTVLVCHEFTGAAVPLKVTPPVPCDAPKPEPFTNTIDPIAPLDGTKTLTTGRTAKLTPLLGTPAAVTTTFPLVAAEGTIATMLVSLQELTVPVMPLNLTLPVVEPKL